MQMTLGVYRWRWNDIEFHVAPSGAGTNLKVGGGTDQERKWGAPIRCEAPKQNFGRAPPLFGYKSTISRFGERFRDGQYSLVSFLFAVLLLTVPPCSAICKSGGTCSPCLMESAPLIAPRGQVLNEWGNVALRISLYIHILWFSCTGKCNFCLTPWAHIGLHVD